MIVTSFLLSELSLEFPPERNLLPDEHSVTSEDLEN